MPLDSGALVCTWAADSHARFEPGPQPHQMFRGDRFAETLRRVRALKAEVAPWCPSLAEAAMCFVLAHEAVSTPIPGMTSPEAVDMNVRYCDGAAFPEKLMSRLPAHAWVRNLYR